MQAISGFSSTMIDDATAADSRPRGKLLHKLLPIFLALSLFPLGIAAYQLFGVLSAVQSASTAVKLGIAQKVASNVASYLDNVKNILQVVHKSNDFLTMNPHRQSAILSN